MTQFNIEAREILETLVYTTSPDEDGHSAFESAEEQKQVEEQEINKALAALNQLHIKGKIEELDTVRFKHSRTYSQKVTDRDGSVYIEDSYSYISSYEVQERIAELDKSIEELEGE